MAYTLNRTSERLSAAIILKVSTGSHRALLSPPLTRPALCTLIQRRWHQQAGRLLFSSRIKACGAACEEPLTLVLLQELRTAQPLLRSSPEEARSARPQESQRDLTGGWGGNTARLPTAICWATERKQPRWRTEPGRPSQRPSILWGTWVSADAPLFWMLFMIEVSLCEEVRLVNPPGAVADRTVTPPPSAALRRKYWSAVG